MKSVKNSLFCAFAMYSRIPTPKVDWKKDNMKYSMCFFPLIGTVLGLLNYFWYNICNVFEYNNMIFSAGFIAISLLVTGGIHLDGFCDVQDALASWGDKEKKLEILKDSNCGAFAIINTCVYFLLYFAVMTGLENNEIIIVCLSFTISRIMSAFSVILFKNAKNDGYLHTFNKASDRQTVLIVLSIFISIIFLLLLDYSIKYFIIILATTALIFAYYRYKSYKYFGGITGDLAGWFLCIYELFVPLSLLLCKGVMIHWNL